MKFTNLTSFSFSLLLTFSLLFCGCSDSDEPQSEPIDTSLVKVRANVKGSPTSPWMVPSEQFSIKVTDIDMTAPEGVILQSISLIANYGSTTEVINTKPFSGEDLDFRVSMNNMKGRVNFSVQGKLVKKGCDDAEIIIADNIELIVFSEMPEFECQGRLMINVHSESTTGEEYDNFFEVVSSDHFTVAVPQSKLYWQPETGIASTLEINMGSGASAWSPNTTFTPEILKTAIGKSTGDESFFKFTIPNTPGSLEAMKLQLYVITSYFGTWENVTIEPYSLTNVFGITEI